MQTGHPVARHAGVSAVVRIDGNRPEGSTREGGGSSGGNRNNRGFRFRGLAGRVHRRKRRGGFPGNEQVQWYGVERDRRLLNLNF